MADDPRAEFESLVSSLRAGLTESMGAAASEHEARELRAKLMGAEGLEKVLAFIPRVAKDQRREIGQRANELKQEIQRAFDAKLGALAEQARAAELGGPLVDPTLPGRGPWPGRLHPLTRVAHELVDVFRSLGFDVADGPEVDLHEYNFDRLGFPPDHPATDMQDSFFVRTEGEKTLLRTHTSTLQVREMLRRKPPFAVVAPGQVYRRDDDVTHSPMFFQIEGFLVDEGVSFAHLKGVLTTFVQRTFGADVPVRFRPSYFPFVEPGGEVDMGCLFCRGWTGTPEARAKQAECRICKGTSWLEILGCGMIHPVVFEHVGIDPERWTGFAFGMGVDRIAMLRYGITDVRMLYENDVRFLSRV